MVCLVAGLYYAPIRGVRLWRIPAPALPGYTRACAARQRGSFESQDTAQANAPGIAGKLVLGVK